MYQDYSLYYAHNNKNKKSITRNFSSEKGRELLFALVKNVDVIVENFCPGTLDKMGLTKEKLDELNPHIIVTSIYGFGQSGPYNERPAFDAIAQAMSGVMSMTGTQESGPQKDATRYRLSSWGAAAAGGPAFESVGERRKYGHG